MPLPRNRNAGQGQLEPRYKSIDNEIWAEEQSRTHSATGPTIPSNPGSPLFLRLTQSMNVDGPDTGHFPHPPPQC